MARHFCFYVIVTEKDYEAMNRSPHFHPGGTVVVVYDSNADGSQKRVVGEVGNIMPYDHR